MEIKEFLNGYCLTYKEKDYSYIGKSDDVISMISEKVKTLLKNE